MHDARAGRDGSAETAIAAPWFLRGGHRQTLLAYYFHGANVPYSARRHIVELGDGDRIVLHDDQPDAWQTGNRVALLLHGLAGCHLSPYMVRIAEKLNRQRVRTFRMDLRGAGAGAELARKHYHSGRSDDALAALSHIQAECPNSSIALIGFSLSGNIVLKLAGEAPEQIPAAVDRIAAVSPPIDLAGCCRALSRGLNRFYDRYFVKLLSAAIAARRERVPNLAYVELNPRPTGLYDFDDRFTAPMAGFRDAEDYYAQCNSAQFLHRIDRPTLLVAAQDDPMIPNRIFRETAASASVKLELPRTGGHLGFLTSPQDAVDRRWIDARLVRWVLD